MLGLVKTRRAAGMEVRETRNEKGLHSRVLSIRALQPSPGAKLSNKAFMSYINVRG